MPASRAAVSESNSPTTSGGESRCSRRWRRCRGVPMTMSRIIARLKPSRYGSSQSSPLADGDRNVFDRDAPKNAKRHGTSDAVPGQQIKELVGGRETVAIQ